MTKIYNTVIKAYHSDADALFRFCYSKLNDRERAKHVMQEAFKKTWDEVTHDKIDTDIGHIKMSLYRSAESLMQRS